MKRIYHVFAGLLFITATAQAQLDNSQTITKTGTTAAQFLKIGIDARSAGMGNAYTAMQGALTSMNANPAGIGFMQNAEALFSHHEWIADINFNYFAFGFNIDGLGTIGASITSLTTPEDIVRTIDQPEGTGELFNAGDFSLNLSFAKQLTDKFTIGGTMKFINQSIWHSNANAIAADLGAIFVTPFNGVRLGASIQNFGSDMRMFGRDVRFSEDPDPNNQGNVEFVNAEFETDAFPLPLLFRVGLSGEFYKAENVRASFSIDAMEPNDNSSAVNGGVELAFSETFFVRGGYSTLFREDSEEGLTFGGGIHYRLWGNSSMLKIDYAYGDYGLLDNVQRFSVGITF